MMCLSVDSCYSDLLAVAERLAYYGADIISPVNNLAPSVPSSLYGSIPFRNAVRRGHRLRRQRRNTVITALTTTTSGDDDDTSDTILLPPPLAMMVADYVLPPVLMSVYEVLLAMGAPWDPNWGALLAKAWHYFYTFDDEPSAIVAKKISMMLTFP